MKARYATSVIYFVLEDETWKAVGMPIVTPHEVKIYAVNDVTGEEKTFTFLPDDKLAAFTWARIPGTNRKRRNFDL